MSDPVPDEIDTRVPPSDIRMAPEDIDALRFRMAFRGYRMDQVDDALDRLREEIAVRDAKIVTLQGAVAAVEAVEAPPASSRSPFAPVEPLDEPHDGDEVDLEYPPDADTDVGEPVVAADADADEPVVAEDADEPVVDDGDEDEGEEQTPYIPPTGPAPEPIQPAPAAAGESALSRLRRTSPGG